MTVHVATHGYLPLDLVWQEEAKEYLARRRMLQWGEPVWLTEEEFNAEVTDPIERWFWQVFTGWEPPQEGKEEGWKEL